MCRRGGDLQSKQMHCSPDFCFAAPISSAFCPWIRPWFLHLGPWFLQFAPEFAPDFLHFDCRILGTNLIQNDTKWYKMIQNDRWVHNGVVIGCSLHLLFKMHEKGGLSALSIENRRKRGQDQPEATWYKWYKNDAKWYEMIGLRNDIKWGHNQPAVVQSPFTSTTLLLCRLLSF